MDLGGEESLCNIDHICPGGLHSMRKFSMLRTLIWLENRTFTAWGCGACNWIMLNPGGLAESGKPPAKVTGSFQSARLREISARRNIAVNSEAPFLEDSGAEVIQRAMWVSDGQKLAKKWRSRRIGEIRDCTKGKESLRSFRNPGTPSYRTRLSGIKSSNGHELVSVQNCTLFGHSPLR